MKCYAVVVCLL